MANSPNEGRDGARGCLIVIILLIAAVIHFQIDIGPFFASLHNVFKVILAGGAFLLVGTLIAVAFSDESAEKPNEKEKAKRKEPPEKLRQPDKVFLANDNAKAIARRQFPSGHGISCSLHM